jgi:hypothetical protein
MACKGRIHVLKSELAISASSFVRQLFQIELIEVDNLIIYVIKAIGDLLLYSIKTLHYRIDML